MQAQEIGSGKSAKNWCFWSTTESIDNDVPSATAIVETLIAVPLYWWIALQVGMLQSLLLGAAVAPLVLLRSDESVALGVRWLLAFEQRMAGGKPYCRLSANDRWLLWVLMLTCLVISVIIVLVALGIDVFNSDNLSLGVEIKLPIGIVLSLLIAVFLFNAASIVILPFSSIFYFLMDFADRGTGAGGVRAAFIVIGMSLAGMPGLMIGILAVTIGIRIIASGVYIHSGIRALPRNFRRLVICTSPTQKPELIPGIEKAGATMKFDNAIGRLSRFGKVDGLLMDAWILLHVSILFLPAWLYRLTIKSTAWFWWPLAFLGGELRQARNPDLLRWTVMGSLWARTSIALACFSLLVFAFANLVLP